MNMVWEDIKLISLKMLEMDFPTMQTGIESTIKKLLKEMNTVFLFQS